MVQNRSIPNRFWAKAVFTSVFAKQISNVGSDVETLEKEWNVGGSLELVI